MSVYWKVKPPTIPLGFLCWRCWFDPTAKCNNSLRIQRRIHSCTYQCPSGFFLSIKENKLNKRNTTDLKRPFHVKLAKNKLLLESSTHFAWQKKTLPCLMEKYSITKGDWESTVRSQTATTAEVGFSDCRIMFRFSPCTYETSLPWWHLSRTSITYVLSPNNFHSMFSHPSDTKQIDLTNNIF